jgi:hypothetical protein
MKEKIFDKFLIIVAVVFGISLILQLLGSALKYVNEHRGAEACRPYELVDVKNETAICYTNVDGKFEAKPLHRAEATSSSQP